MKYLFLSIVFIVMSIQDCIAVYIPKQIRISMNDINGGMFFNENNDDFYINGFAVDSLENFFFCGGKEVHYISCFSKDKKQFSEKLSFLSFGPMFLKDGCLYFYTVNNGDNILKEYAIKSTSISLTRDIEIMSVKKMNSIFFTDTAFIIELLEVEKISGMVHLKSKYQLFDLSCQYQCDVENLYNLPQSVFKEDGTQFIGMYQQYYVFYSVLDSSTCKIFMRNQQGDIVASQNLPLELLGTMLNSSYTGNPEEHKKISNGNLYILGNKQKDLVITIFPLKDLFEGINICKQ